VGHQRLVHIVNFESARKLTQVPSGHPCGRLYGLAFQLEIHVDGELNPTTGMVVDFAVLEEAFAPLKAQLDHNYLNELSGLENPTSEVMVEWIWKRLAPELPELCKLVLWENKRSRVEFCG
jgi:6-pyruvoyltetrahydropterin/6-carboxytetrahydropterin synthase|tara:strand:- start:3817 stop:4179 length:363 start_codon:yes stop_codon:yes gene_type:complete